MDAKGSSRDSRDDDDDVVVRRAEHGWVVGGEQVSDLTSAMVLADLFAADQAIRPERPLPDLGRPTVSETRKPRFIPKEQDPGEAARLAVTVTQLEHALASRVRVEQAIGVLSERHRLRPRDAFDLLRGAARSRGQRITEMAQDVVASATNPLLRLPDELARQAPQAKQRGRSLRRSRRAEQN
jgi:ANTAR domain